DEACAKEAVKCRRSELGLVWTSNDTQTRAPVGHLQWAACQRVEGSIRWADRQQITRLKRPATQRTAAAHDAGRSAAEFREHVKPAANSKRRPRTSLSRAESHSLSAANDEWPLDLYELAIDAHLESRALHDA